MDLTEDIDLFSRVSFKINKNSEKRFLNNVNITEVVSFSYARMKNNFTSFIKTFINLG